MRGRDQEQDDALDADALDGRLGLFALDPVLFLSALDHLIEGCLGHGAGHGGSLIGQIRKSHGVQL
ncbi:MAG: hypothetical protein IPI07_01700 [Flavobacteriales bacterium]|nr:hypothetical protein [Flavobacteriales bacterium]